MCPAPKIALIYVFVAGQNPHYSVMGHRFATRLRENPAGIDHETIVVCNNGVPVETEKDLFSGLPNLRFINHDNRAHDISAFQMAARETNADICLFLGATSWLTRPGWGLRILEVREQFDPGICGSMGNQGDMNSSVYPHLRTTGFWMDREVFNQYPKQVNIASERYLFEHGKDCLTEWVRLAGKRALVVGWENVVDVAQADQLPNGFHRGDQSNLIVKDRLCEPPYYG
jgi:hypothetical protein